MRATGRRSSSSRRGVTASEVRGEDAGNPLPGSLGWAYENPDVKLSLLWRAMEKSKNLHALLMHDITSILGNLGTLESKWSNSGEQSMQLAAHLRRAGGDGSLGAEMLRFGDVTMPHRISISFQRWAWSVSRMHSTLMRGNRPFAETSRGVRWLSAHVYPTHNGERLLVDPFLEGTAMMGTAVNATGEQSPSPWMWVRDYDVESEAVGLSFNNALRGRRLTKEQSLDFIRDLPYRRGALDDGGVSTLGRLTGKSTFRGVSKMERAKAQVRKEGCPLAEDGSPTLDIIPLITQLEQLVVVDQAGRGGGEAAPLWDLILDSTVTTPSCGPVFASHLASGNFDLLMACCEAHARVLSALYVEGRPAVAMSNNCTVTRYLETVFGEFVEKGALEIVTLPSEREQLEEVLRAVLRDDPTFVPREGEGAEMGCGEATQFVTQRHRTTWLLADDAAHMSHWGDKEVVDVVHYALRNGADALCVSESVGTDNLRRIRRALPHHPKWKCRLELVVVPSTTGLLEFASSVVSSPNLALIGACGSVGSRTVESFSRGRIIREIAHSTQLSSAVQTIGINVAPTDAMLYVPALPYKLGTIGNVFRFNGATRSILQHSVCPTSSPAAAPTNEPMDSLVAGVSGLRRQLRRVMLSSPDYTSGGMFAHSHGGDGSYPSVGPAMSPTRTLSSVREVSYLAGGRDTSNGLDGAKLLLAKALGV